MSFFQILFFWLQLELTGMYLGRCRLSVGSTPELRLMLFHKTTRKQVPWKMQWKALWYFIMTNWKKYSLVISIYLSIHPSELKLHLFDPDALTFPTPLTLNSDGLNKYHILTWKPLSLIRAVRTDSSCLPENHTWG